MIFIIRGKTKKFIGLSDTPPSYVTKYEMVPMVNAAQDALEFKHPYFLTDADGDTFIVLDHTPDNDRILFYSPVGWSFEITPAGISHLPFQSRARAYHSGAPQSIATLTFTKVALKSENYDTQNEFDNTTNYRFTATTAGYYSVVGNVTYLSSVADKTPSGLIYKNGAAVTQNYTHSSGTGAIGLPVVEIIYLGVNDYLELWTWHNFGVNKTISNQSKATYLAIHKIS